MIKFLDLQKLTESFGGEIERAVSRVAASGHYLSGEQTEAFENEYARYIGSRFCIGCANGLDALTLILRACIGLGRLRPGDEVIVPANTFIASILAITENALVPVPVDPDPATCLIDAATIDAAITPRTRAVMIVHLYGRCAYTPEIADLCDSRGLLLFEDNAQAHGCLCGDRRRTGSLSYAAGHSFYPGKNLGALGDAGAVTTSDPDLAAMVRSLANYGSVRKYVFDYCGRNSRMDEIQAAVLRVKLPRLDTDNSRRRKVAQRYIAGIDRDDIFIPAMSACCDNVYHIFPVFIDKRDDLQAYLAERGVQTIIHYPVPPHRQKCYAGVWSKCLPVTDAIHARELSLPISPVITDSEVDEVISIVNSFLV